MRMLAACALALILASCAPATARTVLKEKFEETPVVYGGTALESTSRGSSTRLFYLAVAFKEPFLSWPAGEDVTRNIMALSGLSPSAYFAAPKAGEPYPPAKALIFKTQRQVFGGTEGSWQDDGDPAYQKVEQQQWDQYKTGDTVHLFLGQ